MLRFEHPRGRILVASTGKVAMEQFALDLSSRFNIKDLGEAEYYMGYHIFRDRLDKKPRLDQHLYAQAIADRFKVDKTSTIPATAGVAPLSRKTDRKSRKSKIK